MLPIISINEQKCTGCAYCAMVCPVSGFKVEAISYFLQECVKCGLCVLSCPVSAITPFWED